MTIPNMITMIRIILIPAFVICFFVPGDQWRTATLILFMLAYFSDWLDGYLARKLKQVSVFGAFMDPVADKLMVASGLIVVLTEHANWWVAIPTIVIIGREISVSALREFMARAGKSDVVAVDNYGKLKTVVQGVALLLFLLYPHIIGEDWLLSFGYGALYLALFLTIVSMARYFQAAWPQVINSATK